jgi:hypothetical protein
MGAACACTTPTGAKGEVMTFTRGSSTTCTKTVGGFSTTGAIANGDVVTCATDQPAIEPSSTGQLGLAGAQGVFTQYVLRTEELNNLAWTGLGTGVAAPTVTANYGTSPGGTLTAERLQIAACPAVGNYSVIYQSIATAATHVLSYYAKAVSGTPSISCCSSGAGTGGCSQVALNTSTWTKCVETRGDASTTISIGCNNDTANYTGATNTGVADVLVWGVNLTPGSSVRPYIPATSASVTTSAEVPYLTLTSAPSLNSFEVTLDTPAVFATNAHVLTLSKDASNAIEMYNSSGLDRLNCFFYVGAVTFEGNSSIPIPKSTAGVRLSCSYDGTNVIACVDGTCNSTARSFTNFSGATKLYVGAYSSVSFETNPSPVIKGVKADPSPTRFR